MQYVSYLCAFTQYFSTMSCSYKLLFFFSVFLLSAHRMVSNVLEQSDKGLELIHDRSCGGLLIGAKVLEEVEGQMCEGVYATFACSGRCSSYEIPLFNSERTSIGHTSWQSQLLKAKYDCCQPNEVRVNNFTVRLVCPDNTLHYKMINRPVVLECGCGSCY